MRDGDINYSATHSIAKIEHDKWKGEARADTGHFEVFFGCTSESGIHVVSGPATSLEDAQAKGQKAVAFLRDLLNGK